MTIIDSINWLDVLKSEIEDYNLRDEYKLAIDKAIELLERQEENNGYYTK